MKDIRYCLVRQPFAIVGNRINQDEIYDYWYNLDLAIIVSKHFHLSNFILCKTDCYQINPNLRFLILFDCSMLL
jgi:hypothetical protein